MSRRHDIETGTTSHKGRTRDSAKSLDGIKSISKRLRDNEYCDSSYENADKLEVFQVHKEKQRDKKSHRTHSSKVRHAIDRETSSERSDEVVPFRENDILERHTKSDTVAIDDEDDIISIIERRDLKRSQKLAALEQSSHPSNESMQSQPHSHHPQHPQRSSTKSHRSDKIYPKLDVTVDTPLAGPGSSSDATQTVSSSSRSRESSPRLGSSKLVLASVDEAEYAPEPDSRKGSVRDHNYSRKMAYALQEVQPLEKDKKDPFYIRVDEQKVQRDKDFTIADTGVIEHGRSHMGGAKAAKLNVTELNRRVTAQIRDNKLGLGGVVCLVIVALCTWVAVTGSGLA